MGDPVNGIDPSGESALHIVFGGAMGGIVYAATVPIGEFSVEGYLGAWGLGGLGGYLGGVLGRASIGAGARVGAFARAAGPRVAAVATAAANAIKSCGSSDAAGGGSSAVLAQIARGQSIKAAVHQLNQVGATQAQAVQVLSRVVANAGKSLVPASVQGQPGAVALSGVNFVPGGLTHVVIITPDGVATFGVATANIVNGALQVSNFVPR